MRYELKTEKGHFIYEINSYKGVASVHRMKYPGRGQSFEPYPVLFYSLLKGRTIGPKALEALELLYEKHPELRP